MTMKMLVQKDKQVSRLRSGAKAFARDVSAIKKKLAPFLAEGETMPDVRLLVTLAVRRVSWSLEKLADAVREDVNAGTALSLARDERRNARAGVTFTLSHLRRLFLSLFGRRTPEPPLCEPVPEKPADLLRHADFVVETLRQTDPGLPEWPFVSLDLEALISGLQPSAEALRLALAAVETREDAAGLALRAKRRAKAAFEGDYDPTRRLLEALTSLAKDRPGPPSKAPGDPEPPPPSVASIEKALMEQLTDLSEE